VLALPVQKVPVLTLQGLGEVEIGRMDALDMRARRVMQARLIEEKKKLEA